MTTKNSTLWFGLRILEVGMQILTFFIVLSMLSYQIIDVNESELVTCLVYSGLSVLILYLVRLLIRNQVVIIIIHISVATFLYLKGATPNEKFSYILFGVVLLIYSLSLSNFEQIGAEKIPIGFVCLFILATILGKAAEIEPIVWAGIYGGGSFIILQILYLNFDNVNKYLCMNREIANLPVKQIVAVNSFHMSVLITLFCGIIVLFSNRYVNRMVEIISGFIGSIITYVLRFVFSIGKDLKSENVFIGSAGEGNGMDELWAIVEESIWTDILNAIAMIFGSVVGMAVIIIACIGITIIVFRKLKSISFGETSDVKEFIVPQDIVEFQWNRKNRTEKDKGSGNNYKARKLFKAQVLKSALRQKEDIRVTMMPSEISKLYLGENAKEFADIYAKARYSREIVTKEEIEILKKFKAQKE